MADRTSGRPAPRQVAGIEFGPFLGILVCAMFVAAVVFAWTLNAADPAAFSVKSSSVLGRPPPELNFSQKARQMYALGGNAELAHEALVYRQNWPGDLEGWLFGAFAFERLAEGPGLDAMFMKAEAGRLWDELLSKSRDDEYAMANGAYMEGWAYLGLGRPVLAQERFSQFALGGNGGAFAADSYNRACYFAMAGNADLALAAWARAAESQRGLDLDWAEADPDLEPIHHRLEFRVWHAWRTQRRLDFARGPAARTAPFTLQR